MEQRVLTPEYIHEVLRILLEGNPMWNSTSRIHVHPFKESWYVSVKFFIPYMMPGENSLEDSHEGINLQFDNKTMYLNHIQIQKRFWWRGIGSHLYQQVIKLCQLLGLECVIQTPSGWTGTGETRKDYLLRHGWMEWEGQTVIMFMKGLPVTQNSI